MHRKRFEIHEGPALSRHVTSVDVSIECSVPRRNPIAVTRNSKAIRLVRPLVHDYRPCSRTFTDKRIRKPVSPNQPAHARLLTARMNNIHARMASRLCALHSSCRFTIRSKLRAHVLSIHMRKCVYSVFTFSFPSRG